MNIQRDYVPGCIGRVAELHATFYSRAVGFGAPFEAKVASGLADFCLRYDGQRDGLWLAIENGQIHGSVAIDGSHYGEGDGLESGAHLRWFITSDESRGRGVGSALLGAALDFCSARDYRNVYLWTFDELHAARHLYEKFGFTLAQSQRGSQWGKEVNEQLFTRGGS